MIKIFAKNFIITIFSFVLIWLTVFSQKKNELLDNEITLSDINFIPQSEKPSLPLDPLYFYKGNSERVISLREIHQPMIIHLWSRRCPPCCQEMPYFSRFAKENSKYIKFVTILLEEPAAQNKQHVYDSLSAFGGENLEVVLDKKSIVAKHFNITSIPTTIFVNHTGNILGTISGPIEWSNKRVESLIKKILSI